MIRWGVFINISIVVLHSQSSSVSFTERVTIPIPTTTHSWIIHGTDCQRSFKNGLWDYFDNTEISIPCTLINQNFVYNHLWIPWGPPGYDSVIVPANAREAFLTYMKDSSQSTVARVGNLTFLTSMKPDPLLGFDASTIGMEMQCSLVNIRCQFWPCNGTDMGQRVLPVGFEAGYDCTLVHLHLLVTTFRDT